MRKSPVQHKVRTHKRGSKQVTSYNRGKGQRTKSNVRKLWRNQQTIKKEGSSRTTLEKYTITFYYSKNRKETVPILAKDSDDALNQALKVRKKNLKPLSIYIKDGLGDLIAHISKSVGQTKAQYSRVKRAYKEGHLQVLINDAQSTNKARSVLAKMELKKKYPKIYNHLGLKRV